MHRKAHSQRESMRRWPLAVLMWIVLASSETVESSALNSIAVSSHGDALAGDLSDIRQSLDDLDKLTKGYSGALGTGHVDGIFPYSSKMRLMRAEAVALHDPEAPYDDSHAISETGRIEEQKLKKEREWLEVEKAKIAEAKARIDNEVNRIAIQRMKLEKKKKSQRGEDIDMGKIAEKVAGRMNRHKLHDDPHGVEQASTKRQLESIAKSLTHAAKEHAISLAAEGEGRISMAAEGVAHQAPAAESLKNFQQGLKDAGEQVPGISPAAQATLDQQPNSMLKSKGSDQLGLCVWNVQVARSQDTHVGHTLLKTMQIKGSVNESFYFDGCTHIGAEAQVCTNTDNTVEGVRVLKNEQHEVVGYGSCCKTGLSDTIIQVTKGACAIGAPPPPLYSEQHPSTTEAIPITTIGLQQMATPGSAVPADAIDANEPTKIPSEGVAVYAHKASPDSLSTATLKITTYDTQTSTTIANQATTGSNHVIAAVGGGPAQQAKTQAKRIEVKAMIVLSSVIALVAIAGSLLLMCWHLQVGSHMTGGFHILHAVSATILGVLWTLPIFAVLGLASMVLPELAPIWQFVEVLLLAATFRKMPDLFMRAVGGHVQLQLRLQSTTGTQPVPEVRDESSTPDTGDESSTVSQQVPQVRDARLLHVFAKWPFCCMRRCIPARSPYFADLHVLQWSIVSLGILLPCLSFVELFFGLEDREKRAEFQRRLLADEQLPDSLKNLQAVMGSYIMQASSFWEHPWVCVMLRSLQALCIVGGMSALSDLETLVTSLNPKAASDMQLPVMQAYCQTYLVGLRLAPVLLGILPWLLEDGRLEIARGFIVCVSSLLCTVAARRAFPANERHYPELALGSIAPRPVLDQVRFCPFCGSEALELEADKPGIESAACPRCCAQNVPLRLVVRRSGAVSSAAKERSSPRNATAASSG